MWTLSYNINTQPADTSPPFPRTEAHGHLSFPGFLSHPPLIRLLSSSLMQIALGKGPAVAGRKKHSKFSWSDF